MANSLDVRQIVLVAFETDFVGSRCGRALAANVDSLLALTGR